MEYVIVGVLVVIIAVAFFESKKAPVKKVTTKRPKKSAVKGSTVAELKKLTKQQLLDHADKNNIKVKRSGSKADVVKVIAQSKPVDDDTHTDDDEEN